MTIELVYIVIAHKITNPHKITPHEITSHKNTGIQNLSFTHI